MKRGECFILERQLSVGRQRDHPQRDQPQRDSASEARGGSQRLLRLLLRERRLAQSPHPRLSLRQRRILSRAWDQPQKHERAPDWQLPAVAPASLPRQRLSVCACGSQWCARSARVQLAARVWQRQRDGAVQRPRPLEPHRARGVFEADEPGRAGPRRAAGPRFSKRRGGMMFLQMVCTAQGSSASLLGPLLLLMAAQQPLAQLQACKHLPNS